MNFIQKAKDAPLDLQAFQQMNATYNQLVSASYNKDPLIVESEGVNNHKRSHSLQIKNDEFRFAQQNTAYKGSYNFSLFQQMYKNSLLEIQDMPDIFYKIKGRFHTEKNLEIIIKERQIKNIVDSQNVRSTNKNFIINQQRFLRKESNGSNLSRTSKERVDKLMKLQLGYNEYLERNEGLFIMKFQLEYININQLA